MLYINDQTRKALDASRAKLVGDIIYPNIDETKFSDLYSTTASRPNILIRQYVSALVLKRMYRMPDDVLIEFLRCGAMNFQYALPYYAGRNTAVIGKFHPAFPQETGSVQRRAWL